MLQAQMLSDFCTLNHLTGEPSMGRTKWAGEMGAGLRRRKASARLITCFGSLALPRIAHFTFILGGQRLDGDRNATLALSNPCLHIRLPALRVSEYYLPTEDTRVLERYRGRIEDDAHFIA